MPNDLYHQMQKQRGQPQEQFFVNFMNYFRGQNPKQIINNMMSSGMVTQQQLNAAQQKMQQASNTFGNLKSRFGF